MIVSSFRAALAVLMAMIILTGFIYPLIVTLIGQVAFHYAANGSLIKEKGKIIGSELIGQPFTDAKFFWSRPTATTPFPYNAVSSSGSNYGELNPEYMKKVNQRVTALKADSNTTDAIPVDLVTSSGSGLDPHISILAAEYQIPRVAKARNISEDSLKKLLNDHIEPPTFEMIGEPRVNVLLLNLALEKLPKGS